MRILSINHTEEFEGGTELFSKKFCKELRKRGHKVLELTLSSNSKQNKPDKVVLKVPSNKLIRLFLGVTFYPPLHSRIKKTINDFKPDIIHLHNIEKFPLTILLASRENKIVKTVNDYGIICPTMWCVRKNSFRVCEGGFGLKCLYSRCLNIFQFFVHAILSVVKGAYYKKYINAFISPSKLQYRYVLKHGYKNVFLLENFLLYDKLKKSKLNVSDKNYFLYIGQVTKQKGIDVMAKAFMKFAEAKKGFKLMVVGGGPQKKRYDKKYSGKGIHFLGRVSDDKKFALMQNTLAVIIPSLWLETGPHVGMETMLLDKPIISSNIGGMTDYVVDKKNGLLFRRGDINDLAKKLEFFIKNKKLFKQISGTNKEMLKKYSMQHFMDGLMKIYAKLLR